MGARRFPAGPGRRGGPDDLGRRLHPGPARARPRRRRRRFLAGHRGPARPQRGLAALHDALPAADCPFSWTAEDRIAAAQRAAAAGRLDTSDWAPEHLELGIEGVLARVQDIPPADKLVVCHGDACAPNTLITGDGRWSGHVDLGDLGVADRWADLAIATWRTGWNYGPGWEQVLLDAYGIKQDEQRTRYYRLLWELG